MNLDPAHLTVEYIRAGNLRGELPEFYDLETVVENNNWHEKQNVFDHSLAAVKALDNYLLEHPPVHDSLDQSYGRYRRYELLRLAVLLHDIGKFQTVYAGPDGQTIAPSHGPIGRWVTVPILRRLKFDQAEMSYVADLIGDHIVACDLVELTVKTGKQTFVELLKSMRPDAWREFLLLVYADITGCKTESTVIMEEIKARQALITDLLQ